MPCSWRGGCYTAPGSMEPKPNCKGSRKAGRNATRSCRRPHRRAGPEQPAPWPWPRPIITTAASPALAAWQDWVKEWGDRSRRLHQGIPHPRRRRDPAQLRLVQQTESGRPPRRWFTSAPTRTTRPPHRQGRPGGQQLTDGVAYDYNHVTVTGLEANTTYYYTVGEERRTERGTGVQDRQLRLRKMLIWATPRSQRLQVQPPGGEEA